jgi:hypothetical protein
MPERRLDVVAPVALVARVGTGLQIGGADPLVLVPEVTHGPSASVHHSPAQRSRDAARHGVDLGEEAGQGLTGFPGGGVSHRPIPVVRPPRGVGPDVDPERRVDT